MNEELMKNPCVIAQLEGFSPNISYLLKMMSYVRMTTLMSVKGLSVEQLDYQFSDTSNSIGALLAHSAAVEKWFQVYTFEDREMNEEEYSVIKPAMELGAAGRENIKGKTLEFYLGELRAVRSKTHSEFKKRSDDWLFEEKKFDSGMIENNYFSWFHVFEDEVNHRGQIRLIRKMQKENKI